MNITEINEQTKYFITNSYPITGILENLVKKIIDTDSFDNKMKAAICINIANTEKKLIDGSDEYLQLLSVFMHIKSTYLGINL